MEVQVNVNKVLELTRTRLNEATSENIVLHCLIEQQQEEITQLKLAIDELGEEVNHGNQGKGEPDLRSVGEAR